MKPSFALKSAAAAYTKSSWIRIVAPAADVMSEASQGVSAAAVDRFRLDITRYASAASRVKSEWRYQC